MSIRLRLTLLYTGLTAIALVLFSLVLYWVLQWSFIQTVDANLFEVANKVARHFQVRGTLPPLESLADRTTFVQVRLRDGRVFRSGNYSGVFPMPENAEETAVYTNEKAAEGERYRLYTVPVGTEDQVLFHVQVAQTMELLNVATDRMQLPLVGGTLLFMLFAAGGSWWLARRAIAPIDAVASAAQAVGESADLSLRVPYRGPRDEVGVVVHTFNAMLDQLQGVYGRLAAAMDAQQRFVADASHELRTPLTIIRGNIDYLLKAQRLDSEALADMASEAERMTRLVEELLTMARADAGQAPELTPVYLGPLVHEVCRKAQALPHDAAFVTELPEALNRVTIRGHGEWLSRALLILIDNAFKYTPSGTVTVRAGRRGEGVVLQVQDTGIGIAPEDLPHIFERFYRADRARSRGGTGLGLAIARWVAGVHGGTLTAESQPGVGSTFTLWLPMPGSDS